MAVFYFMFSCIDWMFIAIGNTIYDEQRFHCFYEVYLVSANTSDSVFLLFHSIFIFAFSFLIWYIFYRIPDNYGLLSKRKTAQMRINENFRSMHGKDG